MKALSRFFVVLTLSLSQVAFAQTGVVVPGDNLVVEGVPKIPASIAETVNRYTEFRTASLNSWHPTKREMLIDTRFGDAPQIHHLKFPGGARTQLTFFADRVRDASFQPKKADYFIFSKDTGGGEFFQYYRYNLADGDVTLLTDGASRNTGASWSNAGDRIVYGSTRRNKKDVDLYVVDPLKPQETRMLAQHEGGGWEVADWSPDDRKIVVGEYLSANESYLWLYDVATGEKTLLTPKGGAEKIFYGGMQFSGDGKGLYVATDRDSEFQRLSYVDLATKQHTYLTDHIKWDVDNFDVSEDGRMVAFVTNEDGINRLRLLDTKSGKERPAPQLPIGLIGGIEWHDNNHDFGFTLTSARSTTDVYSMDVTSGKVERWTTSETGGLNTENFSEPELVRWKSFDDKMISGFLYMPPQGKFAGKRPVVIDIHGGPEGQAQPGFLGRNNYFLNEMGVALIYPNVRGSSGYGKTFLKLDNGFSREDSYKDIGALLD